MTKDHILQVVVKHIKNAVGGLTDIDPSQSMAHYGASSLDVVTIVSGVMRELRIKIPRTELKNIASINGLVDLFCVHAEA